MRGGKVFVAKRGPSGSCGGLWEFPGGKVERGESDEEALSREFDEEFGVEARPRRLLGETRFAHNGTDRALAAWLIEFPTSAKLELREHADAAWVALEELAGLDLVDSDRKLIEFVRAYLLG